MREETGGQITLSRGFAFGEQRNRTLASGGCGIKDRRKDSTKNIRCAFMLMEMRQQRGATDICGSELYDIR